MARIRSASSTHTPTPKKTRQSGYAITVKGFVAVNQTDFAAQRQVLDAMEAAATGDIAAAAALMTDVQVQMKLTTRTVKSATEVGERQAA